MDGRDLVRLHEAERDRFRGEHRIVFQSFNLLAGFTALENVLLGMAFGQGRRDTGARPRAARTGRTGATAAAQARRGFSIGEQQRVAVARSLANRPRLLLADEPTASVDAKNQQQVIDLIRETCEEEGVALLLVTHAPEIADPV